MRHKFSVLSTVGYAKNLLLDHIGCLPWEQNRMIMVSGDTIFNNVPVLLKDEDNFVDLFCQKNHSGKDLLIKDNATIVISNLFDKLLPSHETSCFPDPEEECSRKFV